MAIQLNTNKQLTEFMGSISLPTDFSSRKKLFTESGLEKRLGTYAGSSSQDSAFLKQLQSTQATKNPFGTIGTLNASGQLMSQQASQARAQVGSTGVDLFGKPITYQAAQQQAPQQGQQAPKTAGITPTAKQSSVPQAYNIPSASGASDALEAIKKRIATEGITDNAGNMLLPPGAYNPQTNTAAQPTPETPGETSAADGIEMPKAPSATDMLAQVLNSPQFQLFQERQTALTTLEMAQAEAEKAENEQTFEQKKKQFEESMGRRGLFMSGETTQGVNQLVEALASSQLGVDRKLAGVLLDANFDLRERIMDDVAKVVQEAQKDNDKAIEQLNKVGLAVVGDKLVPTLEAQRLRNDEEKADLAHRLSLLQFEQRLNEFDALQEQRGVSNELNVQRLQISANNAYTNQERNAILNQIREIQLLNMTAVSPGQIVNAATGLPAKLTAAEKDKLSDFDDFINRHIPRVESLLGAVTTGGVAGRYMTFAQDKPFVQSTLSQNQQAFLTTLGDMNNTLLYLRSGKQINEQEFQRLKQTLPSPNFTNEQNRTSLNEFRTTMMESYKAQLRVSGYGVAGETTTNPDALLLEATEPSDEDFDYINSLGLGEE